MYIYIKKNVYQTFLSQRNRAEQFFVNQIMFMQNMKVSCKDQ